MASTLNDITSPFDKHWDLSLKADQEHWLVALTASSNHVSFDVSVATAATFLELLKDKSKYYHWGPLMSVPINSDGLFDKNSTSLSGGKKVMKVNFTTRVDLLTHWARVSTDHCQHFAQWFNGADDMALVAPFGAAVDRTVVRLDCTPTDNIGLVRQYKVQLRIIDQLVLHVLKNHITTISYKSFLAHTHYFSFKDKKTGNVVYSVLILLHKMLEVSNPETIIENFSFKDKKTGNVVYSVLILLHKMLEVSNPETIIEVCHLEKQLDEITLWPEHKNNVHQLTNKMITILQEIHAKSGTMSYTDQRFITNLFRALSSSPTEKFLLFVDQLKNQWIMEEITTPSDIIVKLDKMHKNMVTDGTWVTTNKKDTKIVALTSSFQEIRKRVGELTKHVSFSGDKSGGDSKKNGGGKGNTTDGGAKSTKTRCPEWQVTKKGSSLTNEGKKYSWCPHHHL